MYGHRGSSDCWSLDWSQEFLGIWKWHLNKAGGAARCYIKDSNVYQRRYTMYISHSSFVEYFFIPLYKYRRMHTPEKENDYSYQRVVLEFWPKNNWV